MTDSVDYDRADPRETPDEADFTGDPWVKLATDICLDAIEAVKTGELGAEEFFYDRFGQNLLLGLGIDPEAISMHLQEKFGMSTTKLNHVVDDMKRRAIAAPRTPVRVPLNGGLQLTLIYELSHWRLSLTRPGVEPSDAEVGVCRKYFQIPEDIRAEKDRATHNGVNYFVLRFRWPSVVQLSFVEQSDGRVMAFPGKKDESYYTTAA